MSHSHDHDHGHTHGHDHIAAHQPASALRGRRKQLEERRQQYEYGDRSFVRWVGDLHDGRRYADARQELIRLAPSILDYAQRYFTDVRWFGAHSAADADIVATALVWLRGAMSACYDSNKEYSAMALKVITYGKILSRPKPKADPLFLRLLLAEADIYIRYGAHGSVSLEDPEDLRRRIDALLSFALERVPYIFDRRQRSQAYLALGSLLSKTGRAAIGWKCRLLSAFSWNPSLAARREGVGTMIGLPV